MAQAVRVVTVERGIDPRELALVPFGGAGPLHAAQIADELGMRRVLVPRGERACCPRFGLVVAERRRDLVESVLLTGDELTRGARSRRRSSAWPSAAARSCVERRSRREPELRATYDLRYEGQAFELPVEGDPAPDPAELRRAFDRAHEDRYGYSDPDAGLELVTVRVAVRCRAPSRGRPPGTGCRTARVEGPRSWRCPGSTLVVPEGWRARAEDDLVVMRAMQPRLDPDHARR